MKKFQVKASIELDDSYSEELVKSLMAELFSDLRMVPIALFVNDVTPGAIKVGSEVVVTRGKHLGKRALVTKVQMSGRLNIKFRDGKFFYGFSPTAVKKVNTVNEVINLMVGNHSPEA